MNVIKRGDGKLFKRLAIVLGIIGLLILLIQLIAYVTRPRIHYELKRADCSPAAIAERNKAEGYELKACVIVVNATNLKNKAEFVDWEGIGGGPFAGWHPMIRINAPSGKYCYATTGGPSDLGPKESRDLVLRCFGNHGNQSKGYDADSDENPTSIVVKDHPEAVFRFSPKR